MQKYTRLYDYVEEFTNLIYNIYSKHAIAYLVTYYNINKDATVWDDVNLLGGSYEKIGDLTGLKWDKYLLIPVYYTEEISTAFSGDEVGYIKEGETNIVIPSSYGIQPYPSDIIKFEQSFLKTTDDVLPIYSVTGVEKSVNTTLTFWRLKVMVEQTRTITEVDLQVENTYTFFEYDKKIHSIADAQFLTRMLSKNEILRGYLKDLFDYNSGFYFM